MNILQSINPATGEIVGSLAQSSAEEIGSAVKQAKTAFGLWRKTAFSERSEFVLKFVSQLKQHQDEIAELTSKEMGKPLQEAREDVTYEIDFLKYYADKAGEILGEKIIREDERAIYKSLYEPWGVCASIAPWNFPVSMASSGIVAQIMAGNTVIFKPSEYTSLTQRMFVDLFNKTGLPDGVLQCLIGDGEVGRMLVDSDIDLVWFTGSTTVGQEIYRKCADKFIRCILELGGSSPGIIFADANIEQAVEAVYLARFFNCGQVCSAVKRLLVEDAVYEKVLAGLKKQIESTVLGDPFNPKTTLGPLVSNKQLQTLEAQVADAVKKGAKIIAGGRRPSGKEFEKGNYFLPTILTNVSENMRVYKEEVFGPVLPVISFSGEHEAVETANDTPYGLTAEIFTRDKKKADRMAGSIDAGGISINGDLIYSPFCPIGGYKKSGLGREYGEEGFRELAQLKYICVRK